MGIHKTLLYPFSINASYFDGYAWAIELALRLNARLQLFTVIPTDDPASADAVYQSLLAAHGYYLHHFKHDKGRLTRAIREQYIVTGELKEGLNQHMKNNPIDIMIIDPAFQSLQVSSLKEIVREAGGAIILSNHPDESGEMGQTSITDHFYNQLRNAEFYKIPENFFSSLGHDHTVFNYLRKLFQKSTQ